MHALSVLLIVLLAYLGVGFTFAALFVTRLIVRVDPAARGSGPLFRLLILPGVAALWPWMLARSLRPHKASHP